MSKLPRYYILCMFTCPISNNSLFKAWTIVHIQCWIHDLLLFASFSRFFPKISQDIFDFFLHSKTFAILLLYEKAFSWNFGLFLYTLHVQWIPSFPFTWLCSSFLNFSLILCVNFLYVHILCKKFHCILFYEDHTLMSLNLSIKWSME
jgi:hypothetical protein